MEGDCRNIRILIEIRLKYRCSDRNDSYAQHQSHQSNFQKMYRKESSCFITIIRSELFTRYGYVRQSNQLERSIANADRKQSEISLLSSIGWVIARKIIKYSNI